MRSRSRKLYPLGLLYFLATGCPQPEPSEQIFAVEPPRATPAAPHLHIECMGYLCDGDPANLWSGELVDEMEDLRVRGRGLDVVWARQYRSQREAGSALGYGWTHSYDVSVERVEAGLVVRDGFNVPTLHEEVEPGRYEAPGYHRFLEIADDGPRAQFADGGSWEFRPLDGTPAAGKLRRIADRNGNSVELTYSDDGRLAGLTDTLGRPYSLAYGVDGELVSFSDFSGRTVRYQYQRTSDGELELVAVVLPTLTTQESPAHPTSRVERRVGYRYAGGDDPELRHNLSEVTDENGDRVLAMEYSAAEGSFDRLITQWRGDQANPLSLSYEVEEDQTSTWVNDQEGFVRRHVFDRRNAEIERVVFSGRADASLPTDGWRNLPDEPVRDDEPYSYRTSYVRNADYHVTELVRPDGSRKLQAYEAGSVMLRSRRLERTEVTPDGDARTWTWGYDTEFSPVHEEQNFASISIDPSGVAKSYEYDERGNMTASGYLDAPERTYEYEYNEFGQQTAMIYPADNLGRRQRDEWRYYSLRDGESNGYLAARITDADNLALTTREEVDARGNNIRQVDPRGFDTLRTYNEADQILAEWSADGDAGRRFDARVYDAKAQMIAVEYMNVDASGRALGEDGFIRVDYTFNPLGQETIIEADNSEAPGGRETTLIRYDERGDPGFIRMAPDVDGTRPGATIRYANDGRRRLLREVRAEGTAAETSTRYDYDLRGQLAQTTVDEFGAPRVWETVFDGWGREIAEVDPMGNVLEMERDLADRVLATRSFGERVDVVGSEENVLMSERLNDYDSTGRLLSTRERHFSRTDGSPIAGGWRTSEFELDNRDRATGSTDTFGAHTHTEFDTAGRRSSAEDTTGSSIHSVYDNEDRAIAKVHTLLGVDASFEYQTSEEYDAYANRVLDVDERGAVRVFETDSRGNERTFIDARGAVGNTWRYDFDEAGRERSREHELRENGTGTGMLLGSIEIEERHDTSGMVTSRIDGLGNETRTTHDGIGRPIRVAYADGTFEEMIYDGSGNVVEHIDANGTVMNMRYDLLDRLVEVSVQPAAGVSSSTTFERYSYNGASDLIGFSNDGTSVLRSYDSFGALISEEGSSGGGAIRRDDMGRAAELTYPSGRLVQFSRDIAGRVTEVADPELGVVALFGHLGPNWIERRVFPRIDGGTEYEFFGTGQLSSIQHLVDGLVVHNGTYESNGEGQKEGVSDGLTGTASAYEHDSVYRTTQSQTTGLLGLAWETSYEYDSAGNWIEVAGGGLWSGGACPGLYEVDSVRNQYIASPCEEFSYDDEGSLTAISSAVAAGRNWTLEYDFKNQLVAVTRGLTRYELQYDAIGRLLAIVAVDEFPDERSSRDVLRLRWLGEQTLEEVRAGREFSYTYRDAEELRPFHRWEATEATELYFLEDDVHSTIATVERASDGALTLERVYYSDYGAPAFVGEQGGLTTSSATENGRLFGGLYELPELGLYYARRRVLDPRLGRFLTVDPSGRWTDQSSLGNPYTYAGNQPETSVDLQGTWKTPNFISGLNSQRRQTLRSILWPTEWQAWRTRQQSSWVMKAFKNNRKRFYLADPVDDFFGAYSHWGQSKEMADSLRYSHDRLSNDVIGMKGRSTGTLCGGDPSPSFAWTYLVRWGVIRFCHNGYWGSEPDLSPVQRGGSWTSRKSTLHHEVSHNAGINVNDRRNADGVNRAASVRRNWSLNNTYDAKHNADTIPFFGQSCVYNESGNDVFCD